MSFNYDVKLLNCGVNEIELARMARLCYGKFGETGNEEKTLKNLIKKEHLTPFEMSSMTFKIKAPIYVQRQIMRHRTGSYLEKSLRYTKDKPEFGETNESSQWRDEETWQGDVASQYVSRMASDIKPEDARKVLTLDTLTEFIMHLDLRNLMHFFTLRLDSHAQKETRQIAKDMFVMFALMFPITSKAFKNKEVKIVEKAFTKTELGEIWPMDERQSGLDVTSEDRPDSRPVRNDVSDDTLVSEETPEQERVIREGDAMGGDDDLLENDIWRINQYIFF